MFLSLANHSRALLGAGEALSRLTKPVPSWLLVVAGLAMAAGAATGAALSDDVGGTVSITVHQALRLEQPKITGLQGNQRTFVSVSGDGTQFSAAAEVFTGDSYHITLPINNDSNGNIVAELIFISPITGGSTSNDSITIDANGFGVIKGVVQIAPEVWKFTVDTTAAGGISDGIILTIAVGDGVVPGFYTFTGTIKAVPF